MRLSSAFAALAAVAQVATALPGVVRQGRFLYQQGGGRFYIKGVAYQEQGTVSTDDPTGFPEPTDYVDPLADSNACARDVPFLQQLGVNTVRVYSVNSALNHDSCMSALSQAGIYVILDLALPVNGSIDRISPSWSSNLLDLYVGTVNAFLKYDNVLAFNIGNEVVTSVADTQSGPFIKAAARDVKAYLKSKGSSALVSFSSTDGDAGWRLALANYLACGSDATSIDLYGLNVYRWCGAGSISNYQSLLNDYQNYPIPAYFAEFGCITSPPRLWTEVQALYGPQMIPQWSGGVAFSYFPAVGGYGMVTISQDGRTVTTSNDFTALAQQYSQVTFTNSPDQASAGQNSQAQCPAESTSFLASSTLPPTPLDAPCDCLEEKSLSCVFSNTASENTAPIIGELLNYACSQLPTLGGSCDAIGANGTTGTYGPFSICSPPTKLSYALSQYYELSQRQQASCIFGGNATVLSTAPANAQAAAAAATSCASNAAVTTIPPAPSSTVPSSGGVGTSGAQPGGGSSGGNNSGATGMNGVISAVVAGVVGVVAGAALVF